MEAERGMVSLLLHGQGSHSRSVRVPEMTDEHDIQRARRHIVSQRITPNKFVAMFPSKFVSSRNMRSIASGMNQRQLQVTGWDRILARQEPRESQESLTQKANLDRAISTYESSAAVSSDPVDRLTISRLRQERAQLDNPAARATPERISPGEREMQRASLDRTIATYEASLARNPDAVDRLTLSRLRQEREAL